MRGNMNVITGIGGGGHAVEGERGGAEVAVQGEIAGGVAAGRENEETGGEGVQAENMEGGGAGHLAGQDKLHQIKNYLLE